jgi:SUMO ligase MMS21 Smc5/6 complex component
MNQREVKETCVEFAFVGRSIWRELAMKRGTEEAMKAAEMMEQAVNSVVVEQPQPEAQPA